MEPNTMTVYLWKFKNVDAYILQSIIKEIDFTTFDIYIPKNYTKEWGIGMFFTKQEADSFGIHLMARGAKYEAGDLQTFLEVKVRFPEDAFHIYNREVVF